MSANNGLIERVIVVIDGDTSILLKTLLIMSDKRTPDCGDQTATDRSVILAPARLDLTAASSTDSAGASAQTSVSTTKPNNYFSNNFTPKDNASPPVLATSNTSTTAPSKLLLRPSVLRFAPDSSTTSKWPTSDP